MKKVLYLTNIEVPYRVRFFNELAKNCELTVLFERRKSKNRDSGWTSSEKPGFRYKYLDGIEIGNECSFSLKIIKEIFSDYDKIIVGCYNSPVQMLAILLMKIFRKKYFLNVDGEPFIEEKGFKQKLKKFFMSGAEKYLVAGKTNVKSLDSLGENLDVVPYYFSSLSDEDITKNADFYNRDNFVLVVGQYFDYKGLDVAIKAAKKDKEHKYKFIGMGSRTDLFVEEQRTAEIPNVEVVPFLSKPELEKEYASCSMMVLPSRKECWGLVINEAASFGAPIVSTKGSGAAVEFLSDSEYACFLAEVDDANSLLEKISSLSESDTREYSEYLLEKSKSYSIEKSVKIHLEALGII